MQIAAAACSSRTVHAAEFCSSSGCPDTTARPHASARYRRGAAAHDARSRQVELSRLSSACSQTPFQGDGSAHADHEGWRYARRRVLGAKQRSCSAHRKAVFCMHGRRIRAPEAMLTRCRESASLLDSRHSSLRTCAWTRDVSAAVLLWMARPGNAVKGRRTQNKQPSPATMRNALVTAHTPRHAHTDTRARNQRRAQQQRCEDNTAHGSMRRGLGICGRS